MQKIRKSVFETNSSSTHSLCITDSMLFDDMRDTIEFKLEDFGWEEAMYNDAQSKANYLYTAICNNCEDDLVCILADTLREHGIKATFEDPKDEEYGGDKAYIDHADELERDVRRIVLDENMLLRFLFSKESFIKTGNDNDDSDIGIDVPYSYTEIYKGN